jgi:hypothetical protein
VLKTDLITSDASECGLPESLGLLELISDHCLASIAIDELGARILQGTLFHDNDLQWCRLNGWGVENSIPIVFCSPILTEDTHLEEQYASLADMLGLIRQESAIPPVIPKFEPSRLLRRSERFRQNLCYKQLSYQSRYSALLDIGHFTSSLLGERMGGYNRNVLTHRTIKRILRALIPCNDAEASRFPEALRWMSGKQLESG